MPTIKFQDECRYNPERNSLEFQALEDGRELVCEIAVDSLAVRVGSADEAVCVAAFREYRTELLKIAERLQHRRYDTFGSCADQQGNVGELSQTPAR